MERSAVMGAREWGEGEAVEGGPGAAVKGLSRVALRWGIRELTGVIKFIGQNALFVGVLPGALEVGRVGA